MTAPEPADYAYLPHDAEYLRGLPDRPELAGLPADQRFDHARRQQLDRRHTEGVARPLVTLPTEDLQLGDRWRHILTEGQLREATDRGMLRQLLAGHDPDRAGTSPDA